MYILNSYFHGLYATIGKLRPLSFKEQLHLKAIFPTSTRLTSDQKQHTLPSSQRWTTDTARSFPWHGVMEGMPFVSGKGSGEKHAMKIWIQYDTSLYLWTPQLTIQNPLHRHRIYIKRSPEVSNQRPPWILSRQIDQSALSA